MADHPLGDAGTETVVNESLRLAALVWLLAHPECAEQIRRGADIRQSAVGDIFTATAQKVFFEVSRELLP